MSLEKIFVTEVFVSFYIKYVREKCLKNFFGPIFSGTHTILKVAKHD